MTATLNDVTEESVSLLYIVYPSRLDVDLVDRVRT